MEVMTLVRGAVIAVAIAVEAAEGHRVVAHAPVVQAVVQAAMQAAAMQAVVMVVAVMVLPAAQVAVPVVVQIPRRGMSITASALAI